jgi:hypothetical protein
VGSPLEDSLAGALVGSGRGGGGGRAGRADRRTHPRGASEIGLPEDQTADVVAQTLPQLVDHVTPNGEVPNEEEVDRRLSSAAG